MHFSGANPKALFACMLECFVLRPEPIMGPRPHTKQILWLTVVSVPYVPLRLCLYAIPAWVVADI